jgi:hypothetical protein
MVEQDEDVDLDDVDIPDDDEDDIYGTDDSARQERKGSALGVVKAADYIFRIHDKLPNFAPTGPMTLGVPFGAAVLPNEPDNLEMVYPSGRSVAGSLTVLKREIDPLQLPAVKAPKAKAVWGVRPVYNLTATMDFHEYVVALEETEDGEGRSVLLQVTPDGLQACEKDDFEPDAGATLDMGTLSGGKRILQVLKDNVKVYDESKSHISTPTTQPVAKTLLARSVNTKTHVRSGANIRTSSVASVLDSRFSMMNAQLRAVCLKPRDLYISYSTNAIFIHFFCSTVYPHVFCSTKSHVKVFF